MKTTQERDERIANMTFAAVCPLYTAKLEKKDRTIDERHPVISWLTGFSETKLQAVIENGTTIRQFFADATVNPNASLITAVIAGIA